MEITLSSISGWNVSAPTSRGRQATRADSGRSPGMFGVNADIRATCDGVGNPRVHAHRARPLLRQEPGVDLDVRSEAAWQHGLQLYTAYNRDAA